MSDLPLDTNRLSPDAEAGSGRSRAVKIILFLIFIAGLAAAAASWWFSAQANDPAPVRISAEQAKTLASLTEGEAAEIVIEGTSAHDRNALIPLSGGTLQTLSGFSALSGADGSYGTALKCMTQAIYYEAANEPAQGKRAVAQVVLNRMRHPAYPSSVCGVVYDGANKRVCQFSFTCDGSLLRVPMARQWKESLAVAKAALTGTVEPSVGTATHYHADYVVPRWAYNLGKIDKIGVHIFYRFKGNWGNSGAFTGRWAGREAIPSLDMARLRNALNNSLDAEFAAASDEDLVPGLTVTKLASDRHAEADVGGRIDTTKEWRLSIPDPVQASSGYRELVNGQQAGIGNMATPALAVASGKAGKITP
ncbi:cell wall hydrolase [Allopontixanthobacter sp.]|uniref:cell wall hydrolase n=1 Tax=Allopontixanthobacter sp. TaxID=2906452 RepID=UPI002ABC5439|nr:cell wall hydrolase [Allopontixanthobacter sp.]MDZ4307783.1 cell wall hydrolase [Allopontixanthobacter sp.]